MSPTFPLPAPEDLEQALLDADPAVVFDLDADRRVLRIATSLDARRLGALLGALGCDASPDRIATLPSVCCGSCSA